MRLYPCVLFLLLAGCPLPDDKTDTDSGTSGDACAADRDGDGVSVTDGDCGPGDAGTLPGATETCNGRDDDCDGAYDEDDVCTWYSSSARVVSAYGSYPDTGGWEGDTGGDVDVDVDVEDTAARLRDTGGGGPCDPTDRDGDGVSECDGDCDDSRGGATTYPGATEVCGDGRDQDCDGEWDDEDECGDRYAIYLQLVGDLSVCDPDTYAVGHLAREAVTEGGNSACVEMYDLVESGAAPRAPCPGCEWAFTLEFQYAATAGPFCDDLEWTDVEMAGYTFGFGFAESYSYDGYTVEDVVFLYNYGEWMPLFYDGGGYGYYTSVSGDAYALEFARGFDDDAYAYYYP